MMVVVSLAKFRRRAIPVLEAGLTIFVLGYVVLRAVQYFAA